MGNKDPCFSFQRDSFLLFMTFKDLKKQMYLNRRSVSILSINFERNTSCFQKVLQSFCLARYLKILKKSKEKLYYSNKRRELYVLECEFSENYIEYVSNITKLIDLLLFCMILFFIKNFSKSLNSSKQIITFFQTSFSRKW